MIICLSTNYLDSLSKESLGGFLHFGEDHGRDFFRGESLGFSLVVDLNLGLGSFSRDDLEGPVLHVRLNSRVFELTTDQSLSI